MRKVLGGFGLVALIAVSTLAVPVMAQTAKPVKRAPAAQRYDVRKEVTLKGTVDHMTKTAARGTPVGAHLFLATSTGTVDAHLGQFATKGKDPLSLTPGESVEVVGVMTTVHNNHYFLARTIQAGDHKYSIRNEKGALIYPGMKPGDAPTTDPTKGGQR
jgi:DNA/RNA endonuclease YhcR with UshA esterase domain